jgi:16S rRNA U1498 N3-methylase RsmE
MERFPKIEQEKTCRTEKVTREAARQSYRDKLYALYKEQQKIK